MFTKVEFYQSKNYELFSFFDFNRAVTKKHVKTLMDSMKKRGFCGSILVIKTNIIDNTMRYYILDGQHRFTAAKELGIPFTFSIVEVDSKIELANYIADVNNSSRAWGTNQFLDVWSKMYNSKTGKHKEYVKLKRIFEETKIQITPLILIYGGTNDMTDFRNGELKFIDEAEGDTIINQILDLNDYLPTKSFCRRSIVKAMRHPNYDHKVIKPYIIRQFEASSFPENEGDLKVELFRLIKLSHRLKK